MGVSGGSAGGLTIRGVGGTPTIYADVLEFDTAAVTLTEPVSDVARAVVTGGATLGANSFTNKQTIDPPDNTEAIVITGYSLAGANVQPAISISGTLNTTGAPDIVLIDIAHTASAVGTNFVNLKYGAAQKLKINKDGKIYASRSAAEGGINLVYSFLDDPDTGFDIFQGAIFYRDANEVVWFTRSGTVPEVHVPSNGRIGFEDGGFTVGFSTYLSRVANGIAKFTDWYQWAGQSYQGADATNATATMANTGLSVTVKSGRKYGFKCILFVSDSVAADGVKIDFNGGSATATNFRAQVTAFDTALALSAQLTGLADVAAAATVTGSGVIEIHGSFEPSANGTFIPRFAQNAHTTGTLTLFRGSHILCWDCP